MERIAEQGVDVSRVILVGGGARSEAVRRIAPAILGVPVHVPTPAEYVALWRPARRPGRCPVAKRPLLWTFGVTASYSADPNPRGVRPDNRRLRCCARQ